MFNSSTSGPNGSHAILPAAETDAQIRGSQDMCTFLHIGLHKTATTFFQHHVFPLLDPGRVLFNPPELLFLVQRILSCDRSSYGAREDLIQEARRVLSVLSDANKGRKLLISEEDISQKFAQLNFEENAVHLKRVFPQASIILFLRFQPDWLVSAYKQRVKHYPELEIDDFLNFKGSEFGPAKSAVTVDALGLDFSRLLSSYAHHYGKRNLRTFFYEDFRRDNKRITDSIAGVLGVENRTKGYFKVYKGDSALIIRTRIRVNRIRRLLTGRAPSKPAFREPRNPFSKPAWVKGALPGLLWAIIRKVDQKIWYRMKTSELLDWDLLRGRKRKILEAHYREQNRFLLDYFDTAEIPPVYLEKHVVDTRSAPSSTLSKQVRPETVPDTGNPGGSPERKYPLNPINRLSGPRESLG